MAPSARESRPRKGGLPVVASIPHGSTFIPKDFSPDLVDHRLLWVDAFTPELYGFLSGMGCSVVQSEYSQFVANPNRRPDSPRFGPFWEGIVASTNSDGEALYSNPPSHGAIDERISLACDGYHAAIDSAVEERLECFDRVLLLDLHSFGVGLGVDVVISDGNGTTSRPHIVDALERSFAAAGLVVGRNLRFSGGWIVRRHAGHDRVDAVQIELNQRCYADPDAVDARRLPLPHEPERVARAAALLARALGPVLRELTTL